MVLDFTRYALCSCVATALLASCGQQHASLPPQAQPAISLSSQPLAGNGYQVLYRFQGNSNSQGDGDDPQSSLIAVKDRLYGTTVIGGDQNFSACGASEFFAGCGTVFEVSTSGKERVLYRFAGGSDGFFPLAGLLNVNGTLYGTTSAGGGIPCKKDYGLTCGTVFALSLSGQERVLHRFAGPPDGAEPSANLIALNGTLYGTTPNGGSVSNGCDRSAGCGVVFQVSPSGTERVVYAFKGGKDGAFPSGPLFSLHGTLYGMTSGGDHSCGTVFKVSTSGSESVVHNFGGSGDGCRPVGGLVAINGILYGMTAYDIGGGACDCGTVFALSTAGRENVIYSFQGGEDGRVPIAGLIALKGALYGTTPQGGDGCSASLGCGTVFTITTSGFEQVLYAFKGGDDGALPEAGLYALRGTLYGTTAGGGGYSCGYASSEDCGTVFKILP